MLDLAKQHDIHGRKLEAFVDYFPEVLSDLTKGKKKTGSDGGVVHCFNQVLVSAAALREHMKSHLVLGPKLARSIEVNSLQMPADLLHTSTIPLSHSGAQKRPVALLALADIPELQPDPDAHKERMIFGWKRDDVISQFCISVALSVLEFLDPTRTHKHRAHTFECTA